MNQRQQLRALLARPGSFIVPGTYDCLSARIAEQAGFEAISVSGAATAAALLGLPDLGLVTMTEVARHVQNITRAVAIPVMADCDAGYGNPLNVMRTVREFEAAGAAAISIEDQVSPKRCGHFRGKQVIDRSEMVQKLRAAREARQDPDLVLVARTDALAVEGVGAALDRARAYIDAGAEVVFVEAAETRDQVERIARELGGLGAALKMNLVEGGKTPLRTVAELEALGFKVLNFSGSLQKVAIHAMQEFARVFRATGDLGAFYPSRMVSIDERSALLDLPGFYALEARFASATREAPLP